MCGIAGGIALRPQLRPDRDRLRRASSLMSHRGPDGDGYWEAPSGRAALAHRRLSVIDLATGHQPMVNEAGEVGIAFNGEIYNYRELRKNLAGHGSVFRTDSDTEVILRMYESRGIESVQALRGMFAFAVWDDRDQRLILARDRIGKKPLYHYVTNDGCLYFASSLRALRETSDDTWRIDLSALDAFMTLGYIPAPRTIYQEVSKLEAGNVLTVVASRITTQRYWDLAADQEAFAESYSGAVDQLDEILNTAVKLRLRSDVPLGVFLSGGVDSSLVAAVASRHSAAPLATFSIGFDVATFDESEYAGQVAAYLGTQHHLFRAQPDLLRTIPEMVWHFGEPFADPSALPTWMLAQETRNHVTVALAGDGGDEAFAGYPWYRNAARLRRVTSALPKPVFALASRTFDGILRTASERSSRAGRVRRGLAMLSVEDGAQRFALMRSFIGSAESETLYAGELRGTRGDDSGDAIRLLIDRYLACGGSHLRRMRYVDITSYLADCLMPKVDVATMAHGLEARAPLLDQELVRFALSLPDQWLLDRRGGKKVLRAVLARYLPPSLFERPKQGFSVPLATWFKGTLRHAVSALPNSERLIETGWLQSAGIELLVREHITGLRDHSQRLFSLLVLDEWLKTR